MEVVSSKQYREKTKKAAEILESAGNNLDPEFKKKLEIDKKRGEVHRKIEALTSSTANVFTPTAANDNSIAGYYDGESNIREDVLDDPDFASHVLIHEKLHGKAMTILSLRQYLPLEHTAALARALEVEDIGKVDLVEGFTELLTIKQDKKNQKCAYTSTVVPITEKLEEFAKEHLSESLSTPFLANNTALFYYLLRKLTDRLILEQCINDMARRGINPRELKELVAKQQERGHITVKDRQDANKVLMKIWNEDQEIANTRTALAA